MRTLISFILILGIICSLPAQPILVKILGNFSYIEEAEKQILLIRFSNDPEMCNPITLNKPIEQQIQEFKEALITNKITFELKYKEGLTTKPDQNKWYELLISNKQNVYDIIRIINVKGVIFDKLYYEFKDRTYEDQKAISALKNAESKANTIAKVLNYKVSKIINIDDDTSSSNSLSDYEFLDINPELFEMLKEYLLSGDEGERKSDPSKRAAYNLWVTFALNK